MLFVLEGNKLRVCNLQGWSSVCPLAANVDKPLGCVYLGHRFCHAGQASVTLHSLRCPDQQQSGLYLIYIDIFCHMQS